MLTLSIIVTCTTIKGAGPAIKCVLNLLVQISWSWARLGPLENAWINEIQYDRMSIYFWSNLVNAHFWVIIVCCKSFKATRFDQGRVISNLRACQIINCCSSFLFLGLYRKMVSYVLLCSGLGSPTEIAVVREATGNCKSYVGSASDNLLSIFFPQRLCKVFFRRLSWEHLWHLVNRTRRSSWESWLV